MITIFQHGAGEPPGCIIDILEIKELLYEIIQPYSGDEIPESIPSSHYIFLGGLMSVNDEGQYPWLVQEKKLIKDAIGSDIPVLGICLGAQLIASSFSREVRQCEEEKGWTPIRNLDRSVFKRFGETTTVFEWHNECFDLPAGSTLLCEGGAVKNQMFSIGSATGVQFHPEVTESIIQQWVAGEPGHLKEEILSGIPLFIGRSRLLCSAMMDDFIRKGD
jgi:GMP synthase (glutamine-hydrolysing)